MASQQEGRIRQMERIRMATVVLTAVLLGGGLGLSLSIIFLAPGLLLLALAGVAALVGWGAGAVLSHMRQEQPVVEPVEHSKAQVTPQM